MHQKDVSLELCIGNMDLGGIINTNPNVSPYPFSYSILPGLERYGRHRAIWGLLLKRGTPEHRNTGPPEHRNNPNNPNNPEQQQRN
jgi:hypothetical protein